MPQLLPLTGQVFGQLTVLRRDKAKNRNKTYYICQCSCGKQVSVRQDKLRNGQAISCGCKRRKRSDATHGMSGTRLYHVFIAMRQRCMNQNSQEYGNYGGRGISVCDEWLGNGGFQNFYEWAVENGYDKDAPTGQCTLDRIDVNKGYYPGNCRWVSRIVQNKNTTRSIMISYAGECHCLKDWSIIRGISYPALAKRYRSGWTAEEMLGYKEHGERRKQDGSRK